MIVVVNRKLHAKQLAVSRKINLTYWRTVREGRDELGKKGPSAPLLGDRFGYGGEPIGK